ncbi:SLAM family member 5-like isoform 2-T2 [Sarcophilus harrisii]
MVQMGRPPMKVLLANQLVCLQLSRVLGAFVCVLGAWTSGAQSNGISTSLHGVKGGFILFHLNISSGEKIEVIRWTFKNKAYHQNLLEFEPENKFLKWKNLQNRFEQRVNVTNMTFHIKNLTLKDHGCYIARIEYFGGNISEQTFLLSVNEPIVLETNVLSKSQTSDWCNLTLECQAMSDTKKVRMTWESEDIPKMLMQNESLGLLSNSSRVKVFFPLNYQNYSITCLAMNDAEQKNITLKLHDVCVKTSIMKTHKRPWYLGIFILFILFGILGIGWWICKGKEEKKEVMDSSKHQRDSDNSIEYAMLNPDRLPEDQNQCQEACEQRLQERENITTIYSHIQKTPHQYSGAEVQKGHQKDHSGS